MGYQLRAVVADADLLRARTAELDLDHAVIADLRQDMALLPVTPLLVEELTGGLPDFADAEPADDRPFRLVLAAGIAAVLAAWSRHGPIGYVEIEFHGGVGYQSAVVWFDGRTFWGPRFDDRFTSRRAEWPVNAALAHLGVEPGGGGDLFDEVGLDAERNMDGWLAHGRRGLTPDYYESLADEWTPSRQSDGQSRAT